MSLLNEVDEVEVVSTVTDPASLVKAVDELLPDAALTDIRMPPSFTNEGIDAAKRIRAAHPEIGVVVLSQYVESDYVFELLQDGVAGLGYLLKERVRTRTAGAGAPGGRPRRLRARPQGRRGPDGPQVEGRALAAAGVDRARLEVLGAMATGRSNAAIAKTLFMSERAVEKHISAVFQKLNLVEGDLNRRVMAVLAFLEATSSTR